jgi:hypothetical protein
MVRRLSPGLGIIPRAARPVPTSAPVNTVLPSITGALTQGQTLTADPGSWTGLPSGAFAYQWQRSGSNIVGAASSTYVAQAADVAAGASAITVEVTATNIVGSTTAESAGVTIAAPLTLSGTPGSALVGAAYTFTPTTAGGHPAYSYALTGTLPAGLSFNTSTGAITGTPTSSGTASGLNITVTDADGLTAALGTFSITVSVGATAAIESLEIMGATPLLDATGDYGDGTVRLGVDGNGWVAKATMPYLVAQNFDPTKIIAVLEDPAARPGGVTTTVTRTVRGGRVLRRQCTAGGAQANNQVSNDGLTFTVYFTLIADDGEFALVYGGTTLVSASALPGYYGGSTAGAIASLTNSSTRPYYKAGAAWAMRQHVRATGDYYVELYAAHRHGMNGQMVYGVEFIAKDSQGTPNVAATQTCTTPTLSTYCTKGQPPEVYSALIPVTNLTQGDVCFVNAKVYPWIGDSTAVLDLEVDGLNTTGTYATSNNQTPLRFLCDKTGAYGGAHAAVKAGAVGGTVQTSRAAAEGTPYATVSAALTALVAYNNTNKGHNTHDGSTVWLMDDGAGGAVAHVVSGSIAVAAASKCLTEIRESPSNTAKASVILNVGTVTVPWGLSWHVDIEQALNNAYFNSGVTNGNVLAYYCDGTVNVSAAALAGGLNYQQLGGVLNLTQIGNMTATGYPDSASSGGGTPRRIQLALALGYVNQAATSLSYQFRASAILGCDLKRFYINEIDPTVSTLHDSQDGKIVANTKFMTSVTGAIAGSTVSYPTRGFFFVQNLIERAVAAGTVTAFSLAEQSTIQPMDNVVLRLNTIVGNRLNLFYTEPATVVGILKRGTSRFNLLDQRNTKSDLFTTTSTSTGRHGSWEYVNGVDNWDVCLDGDSNSVGVPADGVWLGEHWANPEHAKVTRGAVTFTDDKSEHGTNVGGGTYTLTGASNAAYDVVPAGFQCLKYDLAGAARLNDGSGAAGAYERA